MNQAADNSGGAAAMRGFYVQTLAALSKALDSIPPFTIITLEPVGAKDQFDFSWRDLQYKLNRHKTNSAKHRQKNGQLR
jgi:hypothetical protein